MNSKGLALHTWTLDTTPLAEVLRIARRTGWDAIELRRVDFTRAFEAGQSAAQVLDLVKASGLPVACVGVELGWMFAEGRSGGDPPALEDLAPEEIAYFQYSDVPKNGLQPGKTPDRLPPGKGSVPFREIFQRLAKKRYRGYLSYETPNPSAWTRNPEEVAREALLATRSLLPGW